MSKLTQTQRAAVFSMFDGRCAYCGCELAKGWHADHFEPVIRVMTTGHREGGFHQLHPERNTVENYRPSCAPCNIDKSRMTIDTWRKWLGVRLEALRKQAGFRLLSAHGLIAETGSPVVFYFERQALQTAAPPTDGPKGQDGQDRDENPSSTPIQGSGDSREGGRS